MSATLNGSATTRLAGSSACPPRAPAPRFARARLRALFTAETVIPGLSVILAPCYPRRVLAPKAKAVFAVLVFVAASSGCGQAVAPTESPEPQPVETAAAPTESAVAHPVETAATPTESPEVEGAVSVGAFKLSIWSARAVYDAWEPMDVHASLTYVGPNEAVVVDAPQDRLGFGIQQLDGDLAQEGGYTIMPVPLEMRRGVPVVEPFDKNHAGWQVGDPNEDFYRSYARDRQLRLPAGTWRLFTVTSVRLVGHEFQEMRAEITVQTR